MEQLPLDAITVNDRFRKDMGDLEGLAESMGRLGLLRRRVDEGLSDGTLDLADEPLGFEAGQERHDRAVRHGAVAEGRFADLPCRRLAASPEAGQDIELGRRNVGGLGRSCSAF